MGKKTGFMEFEREHAAERDPRQRIADFKEYKRTVPDEQAQRQGARCMDCSIPYCSMGMDIEGSTTGCPLYNLIPEWNDLVYKGRWKEALDRLLKTNNFPEFTGKVCPAPCEGSCTVAISDDPVAIKDIELAIIDKGFEEGWIQPRVPHKRTSKKVAVIGSGPAGLAAADQLNQVGHSVTVYERSSRAGGLLTYGIPNMKLEKHIVQRRINLLEQEGIRFQLNTAVGTDILADTLKADYDAVLICTGAAKPIDLPLPGRDLNGIHFAMDYLTQSVKETLGEAPVDPHLNAKDKNVIVIGSGDTGADCVATALRQGAKSISQFSRSLQFPFQREPLNEWPAYPRVFSLEYGHEEAKMLYGEDIREYEIQTRSFKGNADGTVRSLYTERAKKIRDEQRRQFVYEEVPDSGEEWKADLVLVAIGFEGVENSVLDDFGVESSRGVISAEYGKFATNVEGVFAAGDARRGQSLIVWAINEGREAAYEVDRHLMGTSVLPTVGAASL
ncbi:Glutamate synthase [NADPH] small chain [Alkalibacterium sp. AK22]|uniref:glutamate synthase subunit beta n=1 Tax=Alkalibacterium sp. AK22 TaxID=1229520 RepID=UPI0004464E0B|nr:glutamate synthase subunit beta [Alkalibacterium sp. AK22]EXJ24443.1 Glutamate synthase [NADPH] small chain [Alkalibacterium sp. AK22]